jgi:CRP-like cAMP-binding protein
MYVVGKGNICFLKATQGRKLFEIIRKLRAARAALISHFISRLQYLVENHPTKPAHRQYNESLVLSLQEGSFFGEIALLSGKPRQATVQACGSVSVLVIGRDAFDRLCGSLIDILQRNMSNYSNMELSEPPKESEKG